MRGLTVWRGNPRPCFDRYYYKNLPTKPAFSNLPRPLPPSPPRELDHPALNPNLCPTDSSGDADSDFSDPMKRTSGSVPTGTPPRPAHLRLRRNGFFLSLPGRARGPAPFPPLYWLWGQAPGVSASDWPTRPPLGARSGRGHAPYVWTLGRPERPRNRRPEGRRAVVLGAAMVLSSLAEPTQTRRSRP